MAEAAGMTLVCAGVSYLTATAPTAEVKAVPTVPMEAQGRSTGQNQQESP